MNSKEDHKRHHKRELKFLLSFLVVFLIVFIIALLNLKRGAPIFGIGLPYYAEDLTVLVLSLIAIIKVVWSIIVY